MGEGIDYKGIWENFLGWWKESLLAVMVTLHLSKFIELYKRRIHFIYVSKLKLTNGVTGAGLKGIPLANFEQFEHGEEW